jgi:hypothetical protein
MFISDWVKSRKEMKTDHCTSRVQAPNSYKCVIDNLTWNIYFLNT